MNFFQSHWRRICFGFSLIFTLASPALAQIAASVTINAATTVTAFIPEHVFGVNMAYWISATDNEAVSAKIQAAGNYFLRFPGGSSSDDYHWNSTGSYNSSNYWMPSETIYSPGFQGCETYRGTTSSSGYASNLDDGNSATSWLSNVDTDFPNYQWVYMDLGATNTAMSAVSIIWGDPYATSFEVQYDNTNTTPYTSTTESIWTTTSAGTVTGTGGTQVVNFTPVNTRWIRILMTASAAGAGGAYSIAELYLLNGTTQISVNNSAEGTQSPMVVSSTDPANENSTSACGNNAPNYYQTSPNGSTDFAAFMSIANSFTPKAIPLITVNMGTGTPQEAAAWVYYANVVMGYGIEYWQIGNETNGNWETGGPMNADDYGRRFIEYATAMKAADPSIILLGPVSGSPNASSNNADVNSYIQDFLLRLYNNPGGNAITAVGGIDYHWYPGISAYPAGYSTIAQLANFPVTLTSWMSAVGLSPNTMPVIMSEYNNNSGNVVADVQENQGLWMFDWVGTFIQDFGSEGFSNLWDVLNGGNDHTDPTGGDNGYLDNTSPTFQPHADYWAMQMMATQWAIAGDSRSHELVNTASSSVTLSSFADYRPDGVLSLAVVNLDNTNAYLTTLNLNGFHPASTANLYTFNTSNYLWQTTTEPYDANPDTAPVSTLLSNVSASFPVTLSPSSISVFQFNPSAPTSTWTPTLTPTSTATLTSTSSPTSTPSTPSDSSMTPTPTFTPSATQTQSPTPLSPTPTSSIVSLTLYPNPCSGSSTSLVFPGNITGKIQLKIFTLSLREIKDQTYSPVSHNSLTLTLDDQCGNKLANGLYYVVLVAPQKKWMTKLLVLR